MKTRREQRKLKAQGRRALGQAIAEGKGYNTKQRAARLAGISSKIVRSL